MNETLDKSPQSSSKINSKDKVELLKLFEEYRTEGDDGCRYETPLDLNRLLDELKIDKQMLDKDEDRPLTKEEEEELDKLVKDSSVDELWRNLTPAQKIRFEEILRSEKYEIVD